MIDSLQEYESITKLVSTLILGLFGIGITWLYQFKSKNLAEDKMRRELFKEFNTRYKELNAGLYKVQKECKSLEQLNKESVYKETLINFFNLCAEEYYWKKRIGDNIWNSWHGGMMYWYNNVPVIREAWEKELDDFGYKAYYLKEGDDFFKNLK